MKLNRIILPAMAFGLVLGSCEDNKMEWGTPDGHGKVELAELPLDLQEKIANYDFIKAYAAQAGLQTPIGVGVGANLYLEDETYRQTANDNFGMFTTGNAMKYESVVNNKGEMNFATIDAFFEAIPEGAPVYGHNFIWHTQQNQNYLKSLIKPEVKLPETEGGDDKCENVIFGDDSDFEGGTLGTWNSWGNGSSREVSEKGQGNKSDYCMVLTNPSDGSDYYVAQACYTLNEPLEAGVTYILQFDVKTDVDGIGVQFCAQNADGSNGEGYAGIDNLTTVWQTVEHEYTPSDDSKQRFMINFGKNAGTYYIDNVKFGKKVDKKPEKMENVLFGDDSNFEGGTKGSWGSWGDNNPTSYLSDKGEGNGSDYSMVLDNPVDGDDYYKAQAGFTFEDPLEVGVTYLFQFDVKAETDGTGVQFAAQNSQDYSGEGYHTFDNLASVWQTIEHEYTCSKEGMNRILINFGKNTGKYYIDNIKFGKKKDLPVEEVNYLTNGSFENGLEGWNIDNNPGKGITVEEEGAINGKKLVKLISKDDSSQPYNLQLVSPDIPVIEGKPMTLSFYIKSDQDGQGRISFTGMNNGYPWMDWEGTGSGTEYFTTDTNWKLISVKINDFADGAETWKLCFDLGYLPDVTYFIDDVKVTMQEEAPAAAAFKASAPVTRAGGITYIPQTPEQKREALLGAMESWIKGMAEHVGNRVVAWDVINEPISDNNGWRGIDGFGGDDKAPVEDAESGLKLNWDNGHFYWGYYLGKEYATKAFEYARKYVSPDAKLFINDYNLEISTGKTQALIDMAKYIDENNETGKPIVDGIGTQLHLIAKTITREQIDAMFQALAATGKLVRITELDVRLGDGLSGEAVTASVEDLILQGEVYRMAIESYIENVPEAQRHGITIWDITDNTSWYSPYAPCIFDSNFARKAGYKGVCDGLAGRDVSEDFNGDDWATGH